MRQEDNTQMIRVRPVEPGTLHQQHFFLQQEFQYELFVIGDWINLWIKPGKQVQRCLGLDTMHAGNFREQLKRQVALFTQATGGQHQIINALVTAERGLHRDVVRMMAEPLLEADAGVVEAPASGQRSPS